MKTPLFILALALFAFQLFAQQEIVDELKQLKDGEQYEKIIKEHAGKAEDYPAKAVYYIGMAYYMTEEDEKCLEMMDLSLKKDDSDPDCHYIKAMTYSFMDEYDKAIASFNEAIELHPTSSVYYTGLGDAYYYSDRPDKALAAFTTSIEQEDPEERSYVMIAQIYNDQDKNEEALKHYYTARQNIYDNSQYYTNVVYNIGLLEFLDKNYEKAVLALEELLTYDPEDYGAYAKIIQAYYGMQQYDKAEPFKKRLYEAYHEGKLKETKLSEDFCFDQFAWKENSVWAYERFEEEEGKLYYKHVFYVVDKNKDIVCTVQTENSPLPADMLNGAKYAIGMDKGSSHYTYFFVKEDIAYDELKKIVFQVLNNEISPGASSSFSSNSKSTSGKKSKKKKKK